MPQLEEPKAYKTDHDILSASDHFKLLVTHLDAYKNDYVAREIKANAIAKRYLIGTAEKAAAVQMKNNYDQYKKERDALGRHISVIREIMLEVWEKLTPEEQKEVAKFQDDLAKKEWAS